MAGTLTPTPYQTVLDGDGVAVSGAKIYTYVAGTTTNAATYTSSALSSANTNPIVADSAGRYVAYLTAGANLRFIIKTSADVLIDDQDNVQSVPGSSVNLDIEGTVGEAVTAGQVLYLSSAAESPALTAGKWYLTDSDAAVTSTSPQSIGVAVSAIAINTAGTIRLAGEVNSAGTVVVGTTYYVGPTPGAIVASAPSLSRQVGVGLTSSSLLLAATTAVVGALPNPITQDLLFTDNTYDIGKSGASRPRDLFASRNAVVGGTLGVSGISTFTADLVATGASMSFQDNEGVVLGTGSDATIKYDGTDLVVAPAAVGAGDVHVSGGSVEVDDSESFTLGTGKDATIIYDGTDLTISPAAVGSGDLVIAGASAEFADAEGVTLGTGKDATIQYDGTDLVIAPAAVGSGDIVVTAASIEFADSEGVTLGTGKDATLQYDGTNLVINPQAVGSGDTVFSAGSVGIGTTHASAPNTVAEIDYSDSSTTTVSNGLTVLNASGTLGNFVGMRLSTSSGANGGGHPKQFVGATRTSSDGVGDIVFLNRNAEDTSTVAASDEKLRITKTGDVYSAAYTAYFASSTVVGWSSFATGRAVINYKTIGKLVFVWFHLEGESNATTVTFTLPYTSTAAGFGNMFHQTLNFTYDNASAIATPGQCGIDVNTNIATCDKTCTASGGWTASGSKIVSGQFTYEMA